MRLPARRGSGIQPPHHLRQTDHKSRRQTGCKVNQEAGLDLAAPPNKEAAHGSRLGCTQTHRARRRL